MKKMLKIFGTTAIGLSLICGSLITYKYYKIQHLTVQSGLIAFKPIDELITDSDVILKGKVYKSLESKWSNPEYRKGTKVRNILTTDILIDIEDIYKGNPYDSKQISVRIGKGQLGTDKLISEGYPDFSRGEDVILFLSKDTSDISTNENYYVLTGMKQGKFKSDSGSKFKNDNDEIDLSSNELFKDKINKVLDEYKKNSMKKMSKDEIRINNEKVFGKDESVIGQVYDKK